MSATKDKSKVHKLALKGSSKLVAEFFEYSIQSILFQRGVYPPEEFKTVKKYGLNMLILIDGEIKDYLKKIMSQLNKWMIGGKISKLVILINDDDLAPEENPVERWQFDVQIFGKHNKSQKSRESGDKENADPEHADPQAAEEKKKKEEKEIQDEIRAIFRQITASVTFLPILDGKYSFNVLVYADADSEVPVHWGDSDAKEIQNAEKVQLKSFSTDNHQVDTFVTYRYSD
ncbi:Mitotic spindle checkpoint component mad2 [Aspergillus hancockii]|nr:Mitotic spindle checkpoint component mad2 [Aspergillus hancockii]